MHLLLLAFAAHCVGQVIFVLQLKSEHPDWRLVPIGILSLAWPYLTVRRYVVYWRAYHEAVRRDRARASAGRGK